MFLKYALDTFGDLIHPMGLHVRPTICTKFPVSRRVNFCLKARLTDSVVAEAIRV
jgi:hypothetical protein